MQQKIGITDVLILYFGYKEGKESVRELNDELQSLSQEEYMNLARMAAKDMGLTQKDVTFSLLE